MTLSELSSTLAARGCNPTGNTQLSARCPAHEDHRASLSASTGANGNLLIYCHAGCDTQSICAALGLKLADLFNDVPKRNGAPNIVATYDYTDESGALLFQVCRFDPKDFRQRKPDGAGGWDWSTKDARRVPFHLPQLIAALKDSRPVFLVEGERDVLAMEHAGFAATCNPGGAGKWLPQFNPFFKDAEVVIIADKDPPGRKHAAALADHLKPLARSINCIELPDTNGKPVKDAADFFAAGGLPADLDTLAQTPATPPKDPSAFPAILDASDFLAQQLVPPPELIAGLLH